MAYGVSPKGRIRLLSVSVRSCGCWTPPRRVSGSRWRSRDSPPGCGRWPWGRQPSTDRFPTSTPGCCAGTRTAARPTTCGWPRRAPARRRGHRPAGRTGRPSRTPRGGTAGPAARLRGTAAGQRGLRARGRRTRTRPLGRRPRPPGRGREGPLTRRRALRPPRPAGHRHPERHGVPPAQLLPLLPGPRRRSVRRLLFRTSPAPTLSTEGPRLRAPWGRAVGRAFHCGLPQGPLLGDHVGTSR